jgi:hypothetical protein
MNNKGLNPKPSLGSGLDLFSGACVYKWFYVARLLRGILQSTAKILSYIIAFGFK